MYVELNSDRLEVLEQFRLVVPAMRDLYSRVEERSGLSGAQVWFLQAISNEPGIRLGTLAQRLAIHQSTASNQMDKLLRRNLLRKEQAPDDKRASLLYISEEGKALLAAIRKAARSLLQESLINLKEEELLALRDAMRPLIAQLTPSLAKHHLTPISPFTELVESSKDQALDS